MTMSPDAYVAITPFGRISVEFPEDGGSVFSGPEDAVDYVQSIMARGVNAMGMSMSPANLEPADFVSFCQPAGSGILILEPFDALMDGGGEAVLDSVAGPGDAEALEAALRIKAGELSAWPPSAGDPLRRAILAKEVGELLAQLGGEGPFAEARAYFKEHLQGITVQTVAGPVLINGSSWKEMRRGMKSDALKAALIPHVVEILIDGEYHGRAAPNKVRSDRFAAFHFFSKQVQAMGFTVEAGVNVGELGDGMLVYGLGHALEARWAKREAALDGAAGNEKPAPLLARGKEPRVEAGPDGVSAILDATVAEESGGVNIVLLAVYDADGERHPELEDAAGMP